MVSETGSLHDSNVFFVYQDETLYRHTKAAREAVQLLIHSGLYYRLVETKCMVSHREAEATEAHSENGFRNYCASRCRFVLISMNGALVEFF